MVARTRRRREEARFCSRRAWVFVIFVERTDKVFSKDAVEESSFCRDEENGQYAHLARGSPERWE